MRFYSIVVSSHCHGYACLESGMSVAACMKQERLNAAKKLLLETSKPINVIARECGYCSSIMLSRTLKRNAGITPRAYRQKYQAE